MSRNSVSSRDSGLKEPFSSSLIQSSFIYVCWWWLSHQVVSDSCDPMDCSCQAPLSMGFSRQEYWSGLPFPSPGDLPDLGIKPGSPALQADSLPLKVQVKVAQSCPTLCDPMDYTVHGILQATILAWVAFPFSRGVFLTQGY